MDADASLERVREIRTGRLEFIGSERTATV